MKKHIIKLEIETDDNVAFDDVVEAVTTSLPTDCELEISSSAGFQYVCFNSVKVVD